MNLPRSQSIVAALLLGYSRLNAAEKADLSTGDLFGLTNLHQVHIRLSAKDYAAMQPALPESGFLGRAPQAAGKPRQNKTGEKEDVHRSGMVDFPWVHGDVTIGGHTYRNVGIRYKGHFTYMASRALLKRSLKIDLRRYDQQAPLFDGIKKFALNAGVLDPTRAREVLGYEAFRSAGVPAPRTAFGAVTLSVPNTWENEYVGLFTLVEDVDKDFLKARLGDGGGLLMKPQGVRGADYLGEDWKAYSERYQPNREATPEEGARVIEFTKLASVADEERFRREIGNYLDVEEFLRYLAMNAMLVNLDSPFAMPQNFFIYLHPKTNKLLFLPWDLDLAFAAWPMGGMPEEQMALSLMHPHSGKHALIERLLAMKEVKTRYRELLREFASTCFSKEQLLKHITAVEVVTRGPLAREARAVAARKEDADGPGAITRAAPSLREFASQRTASIEAQLSGKTAGYVPGGMFRMPGPGRRE